MISPINTIISRLPGNRVLVAKVEDPGQNGTLSDSQKAAVDQLKKRDQEVKQHEANHTRSPELLTIGGPRYHYVQGPDGKMYAIGGEVTISTKKTDTLTEAMAQAEALKKAAISSDAPSPADFAAASSAYQIEMDVLARMKNDDPYKNLNDTSLTTNRLDFKV